MHNSSEEDNESGEDIQLEASASETVWKKINDGGAYSNIYLGIWHILEEIS